MPQYSFHKHLANVYPNAMRSLALKCQWLVHHFSPRFDQFWQLPIEFRANTQEARIIFECVTFRMVQTMHLSFSCEVVLILGLLSSVVDAAFPDYTDGNKYNTIVVHTCQLRFINFTLRKIKQIKPIERCCKCNKYSLFEFYVLNWTIQNAFFWHKIRIFKLVQIFFIYNYLLTRLIHSCRDFD